MIKRTEPKSKSSRLDRSGRVKQKRRLTLEGLEKRQLLAAEVFLPDVDVPIFTQPRNVGTVQSFQVIETELLGESGQNDNIFNAQFLPLGTLPNQEDTIDVAGTATFTAFPNDPLRTGIDLDTYAFDLRAGDILDIATLGAAGTIDVFYENGTQWFATDISQAVFYPPDSPLQTLGNAVAAQVVPETGRYYLTVSPIDTTVSYTLGLRAYRPVVEDLPIGAQQVIFLDFDGAVLPNSAIFPGPVPGLMRYPSLQESLPLLGIDQFDTSALNQLIDRVVEEVQFHFDEVGRDGDNGNYNETGTPGEYGVMILNSRDHVDPGFHPLVTRILIGGDSSIPGLPINGISTTLDVGNFSMDDIVVTVVDGVFAEAQLFPISTRESLLTATAVRMASTISHEAGHSFGLRHTNNTNNVGSIIDAGGTVVVVGQRLGVGPDGIFGTLDDERIEFRDDQFQPVEGFFGVHRVVNHLSYSLATGTTGTSISGNIFSDGNRDGIDVNEPGIGGVTVFADINANGIADPSEPLTVTDPSGNYTLRVRSGTFNIIAVEPEDFVSTTTNPRSARAGSVNVNFGFNRVVPNITGTVFADSDGDTIRDAGDVGLKDIYVYIDLDGDNEPDLGEPGTNTLADGTYVLNFPGPGTYTIRDVVPAGFEQTFPVGGEHIVTFDGVSLRDNFDFGLLPSQDFGDAPDSYGTTLDAGARHGIISGLTLGDFADRELDGQPSTMANGDDTDAGGDDEDGVQLVSPLRPGVTATFQVTATNTTPSPAFIQGFIDLDGDGTFFGAGEKFVSDRLVPSGTVDGVFLVDVSVPVTTDPGATFTRFRLSQSSGIGPTGTAETGEVEDHRFVVLDVDDSDEFSVSRNSQANVLDVLANDFQTPDNPLRIDSLNVAGTSGVVRISGDGQFVFYTPPNNFIGRDVFSYTTVDRFGNRNTASVVVNVTFQSNVPIAVDDTFEVPEGSVNRALNVLDNDLPSTFGGLSITSVTGGSAGGTLTIVGGGQSLRYTPFPGFAGTEQFTYSVQDDIGSTSNATVTVNLLPGSRSDDVVDFTIELFDAVNTNTPVTNVQVGDDVLVRVSVEDIGDLLSPPRPEGVAQAFLDLLYSDELIATRDTDNNPNFPFDISFGPLFSGATGLQGGNSQTPGVIDEVGGVQPLVNQQSHTGPVELFTLRMQATSPGVAVFQADPADNDISETSVLGSDEALTPSQLRLGRAELTILPSSDNFTAAVDDSFPDGRDSDGLLISNASGVRNRLDILGNDNLGPTGTIREFGLITGPTLGNLLTDSSGTPILDSDGFVSYRANANANGLDRFTYFIVTDDSVLSTAEVTIALGNQNVTSEVAFDFNLVNSSGQDINSASVGDRIGIQIIVDDLTLPNRGVFAGFLDMMYSSGNLRPSNTNTGDSFDFDVEFGPGFLSDPDVPSTASTPGIIDELGTLFATASSSGPDPALLATVFFDVVASGTARVTGGPADSSPFTDTLLFQRDDPVDVTRIRYDSLSFVVGSGGDALVPLQNADLPQDVNNDGVVSPIDALLIINDMGRVTPEGEAVAEGELASQYYFDVNGDRTRSALDALQVINYLTRQSNVEAMGEAVLVPLADAADNDDDDLIDLLADDIARLS